MAKREQDALLALFNSFRPSRRVSAFDQLADGKVLTEVMSSIDATHFKTTATRAPSGTSSPDNWVLKMNTLKRLYRLVLSYPLNTPTVPSLAMTTLPEPAFNAVARNPKSPEGLAGLVQICRLCVAVGAMGPANERVIAKIQALDEASMVELMKCIEGVMATLPQEQVGEVQASEPVKEEDLPSLGLVSSGIRAERDKLIQENDELRARCDQMMEQVSQLKINLDQVEVARNDAAALLAASSREEGSGLRSSTSGPSEITTLRADLVRAEESLAETEASLDAQTLLVTELTKTVEELKGTAAEVVKLRDQLDEYRHTEERIQKSENVIEKYKKKLEEAAGIRRELRNMEEENTVLVDKNSALEIELRRLSSSKALVDSYKTQLDALEKKTADQLDEITELGVQLEAARSHLADVEFEHERDRDELQVHQERIKELELGGAGRRSTSGAAGNASLDDELGLSESGGQGQSKTELKLQIRALQRELAEAKTTPAEGLGQRVATLESLLADAHKARERYEADYLEAHRSTLLVQAKLDLIQSGRGGNHGETALALRQRLDEVIAERNTAVTDGIRAGLARDEVAKQLSSARIDLSLVDMDQREIIASARESARSEAAGLAEQVAQLKDTVTALEDKDRLHQEEIRRLLVDKIDLQLAGIDQRDRALERERDLHAMRTSLAASGLSPESQAQMIDMHERNAALASEVKTLTDKLSKARSFIKNQDALFRAEHTRSVSTDFDEAQKSYEAQITALKSQLQTAKHKATTMETRYRLEQQLMLSAWHDLGSRTVNDHLAAARARRPVQPRPTPTSWLGRQRKLQEEAMYSRG